MCVCGVRAHALVRVCERDRGGGEGSAERQVEREREGGGGVGERGRQGGVRVTIGRGQPEVYLDEPLHTNQFVSI